MKSREGYSGCQAERIWQDLIDKEFVVRLRREIKELMSAYEVGNAHEIRKEVGELTLRLINETYEEMVMTTYRAQTKLPSEGPAEVFVNGEPLDPRLDLKSHSPTGFAWGYRGSGPSQLALAIMADHLKDDETALRLYQDFKEAFVATTPEDEIFCVTCDAIDEWLAEKQEQDDLSERERRLET